jgi:hypothetical protein
MFCHILATGVILVTGQGASGPDSPFNTKTLGSSHSRRALSFELIALYGCAAQA